MLAWQAEGANSELPITLNSDQQSHLRKLVVEKGIHLGGAEGREYLAVVRERG